jgi:hypothetical protein
VVALAEGNDTHHAAAARVRSTFPANSFICLTSCHGRYNRLKTVHFSVSALVSLNLISIEHNMLKQLPPEIFKCPQVVFCKVFLGFHLKALISN